MKYLLSPSFKLYQNPYAKLADFAAKPQPMPAQAGEADSALLQ